MCINVAHVQSYSHLLTVKFEHIWRFFKTYSIIAEVRIRECLKLVFLNLHYRNLLQYDTPKQAPNVACHYSLKFIFSAMMYVKADYSSGKVNPLVFLKYNIHTACYVLFQNLAKCFSVRLQTKWLWVWIPLPYYTGWRNFYCFSLRNMCPLQPIYLMVSSIN